MRRLLAGVVLGLVGVGLAEAACPTYPAPTTNTDGTGSTSYSITVPACASGKLMLIGVVHDTGSDTISWPSGANDSTTQVAVQNSGASSTTEIRYRFANGSDANIAVTAGGSSRWASQVYCITGAHASTAPEGTAGATATTANPDPPSETASWGAEDTNLWIEFVGKGGNQATTAASSTPSAFGDLTDTLHGSGGIASATLCSNTATVDPGTMTDAASTTVQPFTVVVRPSAATAHPFVSNGGPLNPLVNGGLVN